MKKLQWPTQLAARGTALLKKFPKLRLMVAGDLVADEALYGDSDRISREAPVLILRYDRTDLTPGGAGNAANNAAEWGAQVVPLGVVGEDAPGQELLRYFRMKKIDLSGVLSLKNRPTTVKTRILAGAHHTAKQQVLRIDRFEDKEISRSVESKLIGRITALAPKCDALLISDYGLGVLTEALRRSLFSAFSGKVVTVDSRFRLMDYKGASLLTPNLSEAGPAAGRSSGRKWIATSSSRRGPRE
jgi:D-glycero-beta-D-manno-heptose-7-phosphate kinase